MPNSRIATLVEFLVVISLLGAVFLTDLSATAFHPDENMWINQSRHLEDALHGDIAAFGQEASLALTMPTVTEYVVGLSRRIGGYTPAHLVDIWDWEETHQENRAAGRIPNEGLLWWSRLLPALLGVVAILATFYLVKRTFNARVGYFWLLLTLANPWLISALQRAMAEAPLLFCMAIAMLTGSAAIRAFSHQSMRSSLCWMIMFGMFAGLAGQTKTNGLGMLGPGLVILLWLTKGSTASERWKFFALGIAGLGLASVAGFVGTNPYLWEHPIGRTIDVFKFRVEVMNSAQARAFPQLVIHGWGEAVYMFGAQVFKKLASLRFPSAEYLQMVLAIVGFFLLFSRAWGKPRSESSNAGAMSIFLTGLFMSIPSLFTPLNIDRYYLLPVYFVSILIAVGFDWFVRDVIGLQFRSV